MFGATDERPPVQGFTATDPYDFNRFNQQRKTAWRQEAIRLGPGELGFCLNGADLADGVYVDETWLSGSVGLEAYAHPDSLLIGLFTGHDLRLQGSVIRSPHVCVTPPGARWDAASSRGGHWQAAHLSGPALRNLMGESTAACIAGLSEIAQGGTITVAPSETARSLHTLLQDILRAGGRQRSQSDAEPSTLAGLKSLASEVVNEILVGKAERLARPAHRRAHVARAAAGMIWANAQSPVANGIELDDVARVLGVSRRTVQLAFSEYFGVSFRTMSHAVRLHRAHAMIRSEGRDVSVSQVATRCGFAHLGRFSRYYQRMFGRLPRETRRIGSSGRASPGG